MTNTYIEKVNKIKDKFCVEKNYTPLKKNISRFDFLTTIVSFNHTHPFNICVNMFSKIMS
jgi:hypothetical protein